ncbi:MAG: class I SAM-dependent methyltransferase, partial [Propionibacteriaceae bacterium]
MTLRRWASTFADGALLTPMAKLNARHPWSHNDHFHSWIIANLPEQCQVALDVGCGRGELVAALAPYVGRVIGNDVDEAMREQATRRCAGLSNVTITGDPWNEGEEPLDLVTMVAVLHHLDVP